MDDAFAQLWVDTACPINWFLVITGVLMCAIIAALIYAIVRVTTEKFFGKMPASFARALHIGITFVLIASMDQYYEHWRLEKTKNMIKYHRYIQESWVNYRNHAREATREIEYLKKHRH